MVNEHPPHAARDHLKTVTDQYDVMDEPGPLSRFSYGFAGIRIWCLPTNHPGGLWNSLDFTRATAPDSPIQAEAVGSAYPILDSDTHAIIAFVIQTEALSLSNQDLLPEDEVMNRPDDLRWVVEQLGWLWDQAFPGTPLPPISVTDWQADPSDLEDFADWVVANAARKPGEPPPTLPQPRIRAPFSWQRANSVLTLNQCVLPIECILTHSIGSTHWCSVS